ncbi:MAG: outer membrane beta-barrel protein [Gammaproteobacteria bacterium]
MPEKAYASLVAGLLLLSGVPVMADENESYPYYLGFGVGGSAADEDCDYYYYDSNCDGQDTSFKFYVGKRLYENLGFEVTYLDLGNLDNDRGLVTTTAETTGFNFSLLGIIPFDDFGYLYGKAGLMAWQTDYTRDEAGTKTSSDDDGTDFTFGIGFAFSIQDKYELRLEFERLNELDDSFDSGGAYITNFTLAGGINFE